MDNDTDRREGRKKQEEEEKKRQENEKKEEEKKIQYNLQYVANGQRYATANVTYSYNKDEKYDYRADNKSR